MGNDAIFTGAGGAYTVTVSATQNVNNLTFTNGTFTVSGGALNHFVGPMTITAHSSATLNSPLVADTDFVKLGAGTLTLGGSGQLHRRHAGESRHASTGGERPLARVQSDSTWATLPARANSTWAPAARPSAA